jgi:peptide/nickel transport system substrate-binding protein
VKTPITLRARAAAVLCASTLVATGCASSDGNGGNDGSGPSGDLTPAKIYTDGLVNVVDDSGEPVQGGTLRVAEYSEAAVLNPTQTYPTGATGMNVMAAVYDTLMRWDPESKSYRPQLAESLESDDGTVWTLKLRDGVKFTDGTALDGEAVLASINHYLAGYGQNGTLIQANLKSMEATDRTTVVFTFKEPWASFPYMLAGGPGLILAPAAYADPEAFKPIGAGPFKVESQTPGDKTVVVANEDYFGGRPHLDEIEFVVVGPDQAKYESLQAGEVDLIYVQQAEIIKDLVESGTAGSMNAVSGAPILSLNHREGTPTSDVRVRRAINLAFDAETYLQRSTGSPDLADRGLMSDMSDWSTDVAPVETNVEEAKKLLDEAKADGFDGKVRYLGQSDANSKAGAVAVKAMLEAVGFEVTLDLVNNVADQVKRLYVDGDFDIARSSNSIADADPYSRLDTALNSASLVNPGRYANPEMDRLLDELMGAASPADGAETMDAIEEVWKEDVAYINVGAGGFLEAWNENVHGILPTAETAILFHQAWLGEG